MSLDSWKRLFAAPLAAYLKTRSFRKNGLHFSRAIDETIFVIWIQSSKYTTKEQLIVTCNLEIYLEPLGGRADWGPHWDKRIGEFREAKSDHWWTCANDAEAIEAGRELA